MSETEREDLAEQDVERLSEALYDASLEEILGVADEQLDDVARVVLASDWLAQVKATARAEAWDEGKRAMAHARLMQGGDDPQNPYRTALGIGGD